MVDIEVNDVLIQVLRRSAEPVNMTRTQGLRVERREKEKAKSDVAVVGRRK